VVEWLRITIGLAFLNYGLVAAIVPWGALQLKITGAAATSISPSAPLRFPSSPSFGPGGAVAAVLWSELQVVVVGLIVRVRRRPSTGCGGCSC
jgi:hypothetical protein